MNSRNTYRALLGLLVTALVVAQGNAWGALECSAISGALNASEPIYEEEFSAGWSEAGSWNIASRNASASPGGQVGSKALEITYASYWGGYEMQRSEPLHTVGKQALVFRVRGIVGTAELDQLYIALRRSDDYVLGYHPITSYMITPPLANNHYDDTAWYTVTIPLAAFNAQNTEIKGIIFMVGGLAYPVYLDEVWLVEGLVFPLAGMGPYTAPISGVLDHHMGVNGSGSSIGNCADGVVTAYTGEEGTAVFGGDPVPESQNSCNSGVQLEGYRQSGGADFSIGGHYDNGNQSEYLYYDGHTGYDYPVLNGTSVYAVADGIVSASGGSTVVVDHRNGYTSHYLHLSVPRVSVGNEVRAGTTIVGETGSGHLHLTMQLYGERVDPYGWSGNFADPSRAFAVNVRLWK